MSGKRRYERAIGSFAERKESKVEHFSGVLGVTTGGENAVEVNGRPGFVWVRLRNQLNELIQAFNDTVSPVFDLPVMIEYDKFSPTRYRIIDRDVGRYTVWGAGTSDTSSYLPRHAAQHQFDKETGVGGGDVAWIYGQQFMPWLVTPSGSSGALSVSVQPAAYYYSSQFRWAGGTGIAGFDELYPTGSSSARMLLVYLDPDSGNVLLATGSLTEFANTITGTAAIMPYMPSLVEETDVPLAGVRLITGTSEILWQNLYDLRDYFSHASISGSAGGGGAPTDAEYVVMSLDGTLTDERVLTAGADIDIADGGAGGNATVSVETGTFSRAGHAHLYPYSVPVYEDEVFQVTGSILDFTTNMNVVVTGSVAYISSVAGGGGGANVLPIFDDGSFEVTGSAISFDEDLDVVTTGTVAFVYVSTGTFARVPHTHPASQISDVYAHDVAVYEDHVFQVTGTILDFTGNMNVAVTGSVAYISSIGGAGGGATLLIYDDGAFQVTGTALSFDDELDVSVTGSVAYVNVATGTFSQPGHTHYSAEVTDLQHAIPVSEDSVFEVTGTHIDFGENMNVVVTGSVVFVSSIDTQGGGGGGDLLIYDDSAFRVTGTAIDFGDNISVVVTGSIAYVGSALTEAALDIGARVYNSTGIAGISDSTWTSLTFDSESYDTDNIHSGSSSQLYCNTAGKYAIFGCCAFAPSSAGDLRFIRISVNGTPISYSSATPLHVSIEAVEAVSATYDLDIGDYVELQVLQDTGGDLDISYFNDFSPIFMMQKIDGISANRIPIYDDSVIQVTGTSISFDENLDVSVTGSTAYIDAKHPTGTAGYVPQFVSAGDSVEDSIIFADTTGAFVNGHFQVDNRLGVGGMPLYDFHLIGSGAGSNPIARISRTTGSTLRSDWYVNANNWISLNAYDDSIPTFLPFHIDAVDIILNQASGGDVFAVNDLRVGGGLYVGSTGSNPIAGTITIEGSQVDANLLIKSTQDPGTPLVYLQDGGGELSRFQSDGNHTFIDNRVSGGHLYLRGHDTVNIKTLLDIWGTSTTRNMQFGDGAGQAYFIINRSPGQYAWVEYQSAGTSRWRVSIDNAAEGGSNQGSHFAIYGYSDAGGYLHNPFKIIRDTGDVYLEKDLRVGQGLYVGSTATDPPNDTIVVDGDIYTDEWQSFTGSSTISGWSSLATSRLFYKKLGNLVYVQYQLEGISNSTGTSFTVPYTQQSNIPLRVIQRGMNAGSQLDYCYASFPSSSTLVTFYPTKSASSWTASGEKRIEGEFWYEAQ